MRRAAAFAVLGALAPVACVVGAPRPPSRLEIARAPSEPLPRDTVTSRAPGPSCSAPVDDVVPKRPSPDAMWIDGECQTDGTATVWVPGRWETRKAPYPWK